MTNIAYCPMERIAPCVYKCPVCLQDPITTINDGPATNVLRVCGGRPGLGRWVRKGIETVLPFTKKWKCKRCPYREKRLDEFGNKVAKKFREIKKWVAQTDAAEGSQKR